MSAAIAIFTLQSCDGRSYSCWLWGRSRYQTGGTHAALRAFCNNPCDRTRDCGNLPSSFRGARLCTVKPIYASHKKPLFFPATSPWSVLDLEIIFILQQIIFRGLNLTRKKGVVLLFCPRHISS